MKRFRLKRFYFLSFCLVLCSIDSFAADEPLIAVNLKEAQTDPDFAVQGEYRTEKNADVSRGVQVVALGKGQFRVVIYEGGLPGDGWDRKPPRVLEGEETEAVQELLDSLDVKKTVRKSSTLGAKPPEGATVLFDGTKETFEKHWKKGAKITKDGLLAQGATTKETFRDFTAHVEFMTPYMPHARGQGRGNSGVYYQGRYETQVLDSFGLVGKNNETGGIYEIRDPDLNACFPPLSWQTYDVEFTAARWDENGKKTSNAKLTVRLNGIPVQQNVELPRTTRAAPVKESPEAGPIYLQNHGNPVRYRNIWVQPRDADQEARRPRIPGFERFHSSGHGSSNGGTLLIGELGCTNCHQVGESWKPVLNTKQAPVLTEVGKRVQPDWMMQFIANPHSSKPGTTMPNLFTGWDEAERNQAVLALTNFLSSSGRTTNKSLDSQAANRGRKLFHEVGCVACHAPLDGSTLAASTSVPLANLKEKYTVPSLTEFLKNPHAVRPSGRMPSLNLKDKEPEDIAQYLAGGGATNLPPNVKYTLYHGDWKELPDFNSLKEVKAGLCAGFDLTVAGRTDRFAIQYQGYFVAETAGEYKFWLGSDDGSALILDGKQLTDVDGIHPHTVKEVKVTLAAGVHEVQVNYFEYAGEETLTLEVQPPGKLRQDATFLLTTNPNGQPVESPVTESQEANSLAFRREASLINKGRALFSSLGCANCHEMNSHGKRLKSSPAKEFANLNVNQGCLANLDDRQATEIPVPEFELSPQQKLAVQSTLSGEAPGKQQASGKIEETLVRFNCYACHERGEIGGPEFARNELFVTTQHEMGDEGRIPPPLNGVGDKLNESWLKHVLANGANDRPYMKTRMPNFGSTNVGHLEKLFIDEDRQDEVELAQFDEAAHRVKATGRKLVGNNALACIKCHTFGPHRATGIQAISLTDMHKRIREDWFLRYLFEPAKYRPGTRMPTGFPNGQAAIRDIYEGNPDKQISAVWTYLKDGNKAGIPDGLIAKMIELKPEKEPIIYRNFIDGTSPRGIAVGYPEKAHLAWDANDLCLKLVWHNRFIDASKHWVGRGPGTQVPLGDHQLKLEPTVPFAILDSLETPWPTQSPKETSGFQFRGYSLNKKGQPTFNYETPFAIVSDFPEPIKSSKEDASFRRHFHLTAPEDIDSCYFRAAIGKKIEEVESGYRIDDALTISVEGGKSAIVRDINGTKELLIPVQFQDGIADLIQIIRW